MCLLPLSLSTFFNHFAEVYLVWAMKSRKAVLKNIDMHFVEFLMLQMIAAGLIIWQAETRVEKGERHVVVFFQAALNDSSTRYKFSEIGSFPGATK